MFTIGELKELNELMLGRGAPVEQDGIGYNKPDYSVCQYYYAGLSNGQLFDLASRLVKYCDTQLNLCSTKMSETAHYFKKLAKDNEKDEGISVEVGDEYTVVSFKYDYKFVEAIKSVHYKNRKWNKDEKRWYVKNSHVLEALESLKGAGGDVENAIAYVKETIGEKVEEVKEDVINEVKEEKKVFKVTAKRKRLNLVLHHEPFNRDIVNNIKELPYRRYNSNDKTWTINIEDVEALINSLKKIENVDCKDLIQYLPSVEVEKVVQLTDYSYLDRKPFPHQLEAGQFLLEKRKAILGDEMGGGKTCSAILAMNSLEGRKLVVCPASLKLNWKKEIKMVNADADIEVINGKKWKKPTKDGWVVINYDVLEKNIDKILKSGFVCATFDEVHYCKAVTSTGKPKTKRAKMFIEISQNLDYVFALTGTPITNKTKDIFNILTAINHPLSRSFYNFGQEYCDAYHSRWGWNYDGSSNQAELNEELKPFMLRRLKHELLDLPSKMRSFVPVDIDTKEYFEKVSEYMGKRKSLTNQGEHLVYLNAMRSILAKEKTNHTIEMTQNLLDQGEQVVIFTNYSHIVEKVVEKFEGVVKVTGADNSEKRQEAVDKFQSGEAKVIVCNLIAGGVGITLTSAKHLIVNDFDWVPANHLQAEDRIHRIGQDQDVNIYYLYSEGTVDEDMANILEKKLLNINKIVDGKDEGFVKEVIACF